MNARIKPFRIRLERIKIHNPFRKKKMEKVTVTKRPLDSRKESEGGDKDE